MAKKVEKLSEDESALIESLGLTPLSEVVGVKKLAPITADFGRVDLNELRDIVNELVARS